MALQRGFLAHLSGFEPKAFRLGGGRSILLSYRCQYEVVEPRGGCTNTRLGGGRSILLSYRCPKNYAKNCTIIKRCSQVKESL